MLRKVFQTYIKRPVEIALGSELFPASKVLALFKDQQDLERWLVFSDKAFGGQSTAHLEPAPDGQGAIFHGSYSRVQTAQAEVARTGFCGIASKVYKVNDYIDLDHYRSLVYRVKGDGHTYLASLRSDSFTGDGGDIWQAKLQPTKDGWHEVEVPLSSFVPTQRGRLQSSLQQLPGSKIISLGISLAVQPSMPEAGSFQLHIAEIKAEGLA